MTSCESKVLLFGPCGNVGRLLSKSLIRLGVGVHLAVHNTMPENDILQNGRTSVSRGVDATDIESIAKTLCESCPTHIVFMTPTVVGTPRMVNNFTTAVQNYEHKARIKIIVWISQGDIDDFLTSNLSNYDGLGEANNNLWSSNFPICRLEPSGFYQNFDMFYGLGELVASGKRLFRTGIESSTELPWVDVKDITDLATIAVSNPQKFVGKHIRMVSSRVSMTEAMITLSKITGENYSYEQKSMSELESEFQKKGLEATLAKDRALVFHTYHEGHFLVFQGNPETMENLLGRKPVSMEEYLRGNIDKWRNGQSSGTFVGWAGGGSDKKE